MIISLSFFFLLSGNGAEHQVDQTSPNFNGGSSFNLNNEPSKSEPVPNKVIDQGLNVEEENSSNEKTSDLQTTNQEPMVDDPLKKKPIILDTGFNVDEPSEPLANQDQNQQETLKENAVNKNKVIDQGFNVDENPFDEDSKPQSTNQEQPMQSAPKENEKLDDSKDFNEEKTLDEEEEEKTSSEDESSSKSGNDNLQTSQELIKPGTPVKNDNPKVIDQGFNMDENPFDESKPQSTNQEQPMENTPKEGEKIKEEVFNMEETSDSHSSNQEQNAQENAEKEDEKIDKPKVSNEYSLPDEDDNDDESIEGDVISSKTENENSQKTQEQEETLKDNNDQKDQNLSVNENVATNEMINQQATNQEQFIKDENTEENKNEKMGQSLNIGEGSSSQGISIPQSLNQEPTNGQQNVENSDKEGMIGKISSQEPSNDVNEFDLNQFFTTYSPPKIVEYSNQYNPNYGYNYLNPQNSYVEHKENGLGLNKIPNAQDSKYQPNNNINYFAEANKLSNKLGFQTINKDAYKNPNPYSLDFHGSENDEIYSESHYLKYPSVFQLFKDKLNSQNQIQNPESNPQMIHQVPISPLPSTPIENNPIAPVENNPITSNKEIPTPLPANIKSTNKIVNNSPKIVFTKPPSFSSMDLFRSKY